MALELEAIDAWLDARLRLDATLQGYMGQRWYAGIAEDEEPGAWTVRLVGFPAGGTFTLTLGAETTGTIAYNASSATVKAALEALATPVPGDILVEGAAGGPWTVSLVGLMASSAATLTGNGALLTGGNDPDVEVEPAAPGYPLGTYHVQSAVDRIGNNGGRIFTECLIAVKIYGERTGFTTLAPIVRRVDALLTNTAPTTVTVAGDSYTIRGSHRTRTMRPPEPPEQGVVYRVAMPIYRVFVHPA